MKRSDINLMAPVGSYESLMAAIQGDADSVYFGVGQLNMRSRSSNNFTLDDLRKITAICKENGIQSYLTLNTVIYDHEIAEMQETVRTAKAEGITAIIASDMAVIQYCREIDMEVHASTQLNISNTQSAKFFAQFCDVIVTARELNLTQVAEISKQISLQQIKGPNGKLLQIESFVHGALCMAISGKCYLSLHEFNKSANRGACYQTCRRAYQVIDKESGYELEVDNEYIMSPKDLKTIDILDKLLASGISVLKIEGRARSAEYVKTVVKTYDEAIHAVIDGSFGKEQLKTWNDQLKTVFNRGFWDGYYMGQKLGEWAEQYGSKSTKRKQYIGKGMNYFDKIKVADILLEAGTLSVGDEIVIVGPTTGVVEHTITELRVDDKIVETAPKTARASFKLNTLIRRSDKVYKLIAR